MARPEDDLDLDVKNYCKSIGAVSFPVGKHRGKSTMRGDISEYLGRPDRVVIRYGQVYFLELKSPTGKQGKEQKKKQDEIEAAGGRYHIVRELADLPRIGIK